MRQSQAKNSKVLRSLLIMVAWLAISTASAYAQNTVTKVTLIMTDTQGNVLMTTDVHGNILTRYTYRPYGTQQSGPTNAEPGYTGHVHDPDTGLVYMQQRYYNPTVGRFLSPDPIAPTPGNVFNFGRYTYANNNPYRYTDPDGRDITEALGGLFFESWSGITGHGFHGGQILGALKDGYNGQGGGVGHAILQDAGTISVAFGIAGAAKGGAALITRFVAKKAVGEGAELASSLAKANKISHIFSQSRHNLAGVAKALGGENKAFNAIEKATGKAVDISKAGRFETTVKVGGEQVTVRGRVIDGQVKIGTAFVKKDLQQ